jgi:hypothetical protein
MQCVRSLLDAFYGVSIQYTQTSQKLSLTGSQRPAEVEVDSLQAPSFTQSQFHTDRVCSQMTFILSVRIFDVTFMLGSTTANPGNGCRATKNRLYAR